MHENHRARLRNRYRNEGLGSFEPHEILELLLFYALPRRDTNALAHTLIRHFGNLSGVLGASVEDLAAVPGMGEHSAILLNMMLPLQRAYLKDASRERKPLTNANIAIDYARNLFAGRRSEALFLLCLDSRCRLIRECLLLEGTVSEVSVHPRRIVECALQNNSVQVMLMHNHPEGDPQPSKSDLLYTCLL